MEAALTLLNTAITAVRDADTTLILPSELGLHVLTVQKHLDQLRVVQAHLIAAVDQARVWANTGHRDMASWLAANGKTSLATAKRQTKLGKTLTETPELADAVATGAISPDTAEALQPALAANHSGNETDLIDACKGATPHDAKQAGTIFQEINRPTGQTDAEREHTKRQRRYIRFSDTGDGMVRIDGLLPVLDARILRNAISHLAGAPTVGDDRTTEQKHADALIMLADAYTKGTITGGREQPTVVVVINVDVLEGRTPGAGYTENGDIIPAEIVRNMCTNANLQRLLTSESLPLDLGRTQRLATDHQYRAILARDGGCRMPDCTIPANWCEIDHLQEWDAQHGQTDIDNLVLWCRHHHHYRHRPDVTLHGDANNLTITLATGQTINAPPRGITTKKAA
jgi:Domain of unknown function (DUF222)